jgi:hypothetical protein
VTERGLPEPVRLLIHASLPTIDALELLVAIVRQPAQAWTLSDLQHYVPAGLSEAAIRDLLSGFRSHGLLAEPSPGSYLYRPASDQVAAAVAGLLRAYDERPVTLIRTVYEIADAKRIQAFADAFRLKKKDL